jgi:regulator of RNase E activity RraA
MANFQPTWQDDGELFRLARTELFTCVVGDVMDTLGLNSQFLRPQIKPLRSDFVLAGRAMTVLEADVSNPVASDHGDTAPSRPFGLMFRALDDLRQNEVYVCTGSSPNYALWGELMSQRARRLGAAGAVLDGYSRDTKGILDLAFPTFSYGGFGQDQRPRGKVVDFRIPIVIGEVRIQPGDIVFGDLDGVCVIPQHVERDVFRLALEKVRGEKRVREAILSGMSSAEAFERFGIM